jgi:isopentenyl-diphosphate delta-isomerase
MEVGVTDLYHKQDPVPVEAGDDLVVLVDEAGAPCGTAPKSEVHHQHTPLHLAFSCWVSNPDGKVLITRRAWDKVTWPGVWSNAFCGHPGPGEAIPDAIRRRARQELGVPVTDLTPALPRFRYRAAMGNGVVENEICPVFVAALLAEPEPDPREVAEFRWISVEELHHRIGVDPHWFSPWGVRQLSQLAVALPAFRTGTGYPTSARGGRTRPKTYRNLLGHRPKSPSAWAELPAIRDSDTANR